MRLAVYHPWIHTKGGGEKVLLELLENSEHEITIFTNRYVPEDTFEEFKDYDVRTIGNIPVMGEIFRGVSFALTAFLTKLPLNDYDAFVVSTGGVAEAITFRNNSKPVLGYCHTPLRVAHDESIQQHKMKESGLLKRLIYKTAIPIYRFIEKHAWRNFDHVMFNSETTKQRAMNGKLIDESKTSVIHPGAKIDGNKSESFGKYFFYPSRFAYYKRQELALEAYRKFRENNPDTEFELIVAGGVNSEKQGYFEEIKKKAEQIEGARVESNVSGERWNELYSNCHSVLFCAMNEDWGIIPIEAGSYEKPIISVNEGGPKESVINGKTGFLVNADPESFAEKMEELAADEKKAREMGQKGKENSKKYTWEKFVEYFDRRITEQVEVE